MSEQSLIRRAPEFDMADRMRKSLREAGVEVQDVAEYLGVSRNTVSRWINGVTEPKLGQLRLFAFRTGQPLQWLRTGEYDESPSPDGDGLPDVVRAKGFEPPTF